MQAVLEEGQQEPIMLNTAQDTVWGWGGQVDVHRKV